MLDTTETLGSSPPSYTSCLNVHYTDTEEKEIKRTGRVKKKFQTKSKEFKIKFQSKYESIKKKVEKRCRKIKKLSDWVFEGVEKCLKNIGMFVKKHWVYCASWIWLARVVALCLILFVPETNLVLAICIIIYLATKYCHIIYIPDEDYQEQSITETKTLNM